MFALLPVVAFVSQEYPETDTLAWCDDFTSEHFKVYCESNNFVLPEDAERFERSPEEVGGGQGHGAGGVAPEELKAIEEIAAKPWVPEPHEPVGYVDLGEGDRISTIKLVRPCKGRFITLKFIRRGDAAVTTMHDPVEIRGFEASGLTSSHPLAGKKGFVASGLLHGFTSGPPLGIIGTPTFYKYARVVEAQVGCYHRIRCLLLVLRRCVYCQMLSSLTTRTSWTKERDSQIVAFAQHLALRRGVSVTDLSLTSMKASEEMAIRFPLLRGIPSQALQVW